MGKEVNNKKNNGYLWMCTFCQDEPTFETIYDLFDHKAGHGNACRPTSPQTSQSDYSSSDEMPLSQLAAPVIKVNRCRACHYTFIDRKEYRVHKKEHQNKSGKYPCNNCKKEFRFFDSYVRHLETHQSGRKKSFVCQLCDKRFYSSADLKRHSLLHAEEKPFVCDLCKEGFIRQDSLLAHMSRHTGVPCDKYVCKVCGKRCNIASALTMHMKTHLSKSVFCPVSGCGFSCHLQSQLKQHQMVHNGEKPFQCSLCGRCFSRSNDMNNHIKNVHQRIRPYKCSECSKSFALSSNLSLHQLTHTGMRPFLCSACGKSFNHPATLRKHTMWLHEGIKRKRKKQPKAERVAVGDVKQESLPVLLPVQSVPVLGISILTHISIGDGQSTLLQI